MFSEVIAPDIQLFHIPFQLKAILLFHMQKEDAKYGKRSKLKAVKNVTYDFMSHASMYIKSNLDIINKLRLYLSICA